LENRASKTPEFFGFLRFLVEESLYVEKWCWKQSQHQLCLQSVQALQGLRGNGRYIKKKML
ncbi:MAG: hypothetical protein ACLR9Q_04695, partial [Enterocloster sp.]